MQVALPPLDEASGDRPGGGGVPPWPAPGVPSPRERLLTAADELFYAEGVIDRVIERADVARASLYSTFGSKDELIRAYLQHRMEISTARLRAAVEAHDDPRERLLSVFDAQAALFARAGYHGCPFNRASAEARPGTAAAEVPREYRRWLKDLFQELAAAVGAPDPVLLASQLHLLYDGGMQAANLDHNVAIAAASRAAAESLLAALALPWDLVVKAVQANVTHEQRWITLYVKRWLAAPIAMPDGKVAERDKGTPQGSAISGPGRIPGSCPRSARTPSSE